MQDNSALLDALLQLRGEVKLEKKVSMKCLWVLASNKLCYEFIASYICQWEDRPASTAQFKR